VLTEYQPGAYSFLAHEEYGYRAGELLITATNGDEDRLKRYITNTYVGVLGRSPNGYESTDALNTLGSAQNASDLLASAQEMTQQLFDSQEYANRKRKDKGFVIDLYWSYMHRLPDEHGYADWLALLERNDRAAVRDLFDDEPEFVNYVRSLYGASADDDERLNSFLYHLYNEALARDPDETELSQQRALLHAAAA